MILPLALLLCVLIGVPLFAVFGAATLGHYLDLPQASWSAAALETIGDPFANSPSLMTVPLFAFSAFMLAEGKAEARLRGLERAWLGWLPSVPAPWGLVTGGGPLGLLLPPSVPLILYGCATYLVLDRVIVAGIVPAVLLIAGGGVAGLLGSGVDRAAREPFALRPALRALWTARWELALALTLLASLALGVLHVQEAAAVAALFVLAVELLVHRELSPSRDLPRIALSAIVWSGVVLLPFATALDFVAWVRDSAPVTAAFDSLDAHDASQLAFLLLAALTVGLATALLDVYGAILAVAPLLWPNADHYGVDAYQLAIVVLLAAELGRLRPPLPPRLPFAAVLLAVLLLAIKLPIVSTFAAYRVGAIAN